MKIAFALLVLTVSATSFAINRQDYLLNEDLIRRQQEMRTSMTIEQLVELEAQELAKLNQVVNPAPADAITPQQAQRLLNTINNHPVVGFNSYGFYNRSGTEIGFCFGRAAYVHLALLRMGVKKDAIKKIWTIGETGGSVNWIFHVATVVRTTDGKWTAIDSYVGSLISANDWATQMRAMTTDGRKATFITSAEKFTPSLGKYSRVQLGLDLDRGTDWYQHYFRDLVDWFKGTDSLDFFENHGITRVDGKPLSTSSRLRGQKCRQAFSVTGNN